MATHSRILRCAQTHSVPPRESAAAAREDAPTTDYMQEATIQQPEFLVELLALPSRRSPPSPDQDAAGCQTITSLLATLDSPMDTTDSQSQSPPAGTAAGSSTYPQLPTQSPQQRDPVPGAATPPAGPALYYRAVSTSRGAGHAPPLLDDRMQAQSKYQAALLRLRAEPGWLLSGPAKRQEAFEALWGQFSIKQWQERAASQVLDPRPSAHASLSHEMGHRSWPYHSWIMTRVLGLHRL